MVDSVKNREEDQIHKIEMKEKDVDRQLEAVVSKYHLDNSNPYSFLERRRRHHHKKHTTSSHHLNHPREIPEDQTIPKYSHLKRVEVHTIMPEADLKAMEQAEVARKQAEDELVKAEADLAGLPERLFHTKEKKAKNDKFVPLEDGPGDDEE